MNLYDAINNIDKLGEGMSNTIQKFNEIGTMISDIEKKNEYMNNLVDINSSQEVLKLATIELDIKRREKEQREIESLELQKESVNLQRFMLFFMQSINKDNKQIVESLQNLIDIANYGVEMEEGNFLLIEQELNEIKNTISEVNKEQYFIQLAKDKLADKGVEYAIMFILTGLKTLFLAN